MAEKSEPSKLFHKDHYKEVFYLLIVLLLLGYLMERASSIVDVSLFESIWSFLSAWAIWLWSIWKILSIFLIAGGIWSVIYSTRKIEHLRKEEQKIFGVVEEDDFLTAEPHPDKDKEGERWQKVLEHTHSDNPSDWRLAIIEADVMLDDLLKSLGYQGDGVGEMLKSVDKSDMLTLDNAWEAHKVRNRIAHAGSAFELNERETKRVISLFESVFREFGII